METILNRIKIKGYKSIRELNLELRPINLFIGANGVGKTNFISFFSLINNIYEQRLKSYSMKARADRLLYYGSKRTQTIEGFLSFGSNSYDVKLGIADDNTLYIISEESMYSGRSDVYSKTNISESTIKTSAVTRNKWLSDYLESYKIYHFHDTSKGSPLRTECKLKDNHSLKWNGENLPAMLYLIQHKHPKTMLRIESAIQSVMPYFERFNLQPSAMDGSLIALEWNEIDNHDKYFDANDLSDGSIRFIALTTLLMQPELPKVIIIDEPELGLHPVAIVKLAGMIQSAANRGCQIIVSTQSVDLINHFQPEDVITVDRKDGQSVFERLNSTQLQKWCKDYSLGELWVKNVINGQPYLL